MAISRLRRAPWMMVLPAAGAVIVCGCGSHTPAAPQPVVRVASGPIAPAPQNSLVRSPSSAEAALQAVKRLLQADAASANPHFPPGTRVERVRVHRGVATVQFNRAFARLSDMGESNESLVQHALQVALSNTPGVTSMRVRVGRGPFHSDVTDWDTPFPVRGGAEDSGSNTRSGSDN